MRRTALPCAAVIVVTAALFYIVGIRAVIAVGILLICAAGICAVSKVRKAIGIKPLAILLIGAVYCGLVCSYTAVKVHNTEQLIGTTKTVTARVYDEPDLNGGSGWFQLETTGDNGFDEGLTGGVRLLVYINAESNASSAKEGDVLKAEITFHEMDAYKRRYNYPESVFVEATCKNAEIIGHRESLYTRCVDIRRAVRKAINTYSSGDTAAILEGLLLGGTDSMSQQLYSDFKVCGVSHITAVSGMHIGAFCMMTVTVLGFFMTRRKASLIAMFPMLLAVMLAGLTPSAVRSGIMCSLTLLSNFLLKKTDSLNSLGIAVTCMLIYNPFYVCSLGFQLSCSAAAGVIIISPYANRFAEWLIRLEKPYITSALRGIVAVFVQSIGAVICTLPFQIIAFGFISIIAPLASTLVSAASVYAMAVTIIGIVVHFIPLLGGFAEIVFFIPRLLADYIIVVVTALAKVPFAYIPFGDRVATLFLGLAVALVAVWAFLNRPGGKRMIALMVSAMLLVSMWSYTLSSYGVTEVAVLDTGNGLCTVVSYGEKCIIIGCGDDWNDRYAVRNHLKQRGITEVEMLLIPHDGRVCFEGFESVVAEALPESIVIPENFGNSTVLEGRVTVVSDRETLDPDMGGITVETVMTDYGCAFVVNCNGRRIIIGAEGYDAAALGLGDVDVVITGRALPRNISSDITVVSADRQYAEGIVDRKMKVTAGYTVSVKLKDGKGMTVYAGKN